MGSSQADKAASHDRIVNIAAARMRRDGVNGVGVAELMQEAGLTHGGFYNHFASKNELAVEVCGASFADSLGALARIVEDGPDESATPMERVVTEYLSTGHRDADDGGCPSAALVTDAGRQSEAVQRAYADGVEGYLTGFAAEFLREARERGQETDPDEARARAIRLFSELVGAMTIARAVRNVQPGLSDEILRTGREHALD